MMRLLVTGGAGFIGSHFIKYMLKKYSSYHIYNLDALTYAGNLESLLDIEDNEHYTFIKGNIADRKHIFSLFEEHQFDAIVNFAAESHVDRSISTPEIFVQTNVLGVQVLLDAAKTFQVKKYLQVSTDEVYGTLGKKGLFLETSPLAPNSPYSASKASGDLLVRAYCETYDLPANITRCSNNYGPYQFPEKLIPLMIISAIQNKELPVYGDGLHIRDWLHVEDHCQAVDLVLHKGAQGEVYNIGGNNEWTNIEIVKKVLHRMNKSESLIKYVQDRPGHDRRYAIDATKIRNELGWNPTYSFAEGLNDTIKWYLQHEQWWSNILSGKYREYSNLHDIEKREDKR